MTLSSSHPPRSVRRDVGFTLLELLTVIGLMSILMGIGVGAFRKINLGRAMAVSQVKDSLRSARLFAVEQSSASRVDVDLEANRLVATGLISVGNWHFEDGRGWPTGADFFGGAQIVADGAIGRSLLISEETSGEATLGRSPSFDGDQGFLIEAFLKVAPGLDAPFATKGPAFTLSVTPDLGIAAKVRGREKGRLGTGDPEFVTLELPGCLSADRWTRVGVQYDRYSLKLFINGRLRAEHRNEEPLDHWPDSTAKLKVGSVTPPFAGGIDEVRLAVVLAQASEPLPDGVTFGRKDSIYFDGRGHLDPSRHAEPASLTLVYGESGVREVVVGLMGEVQ